MPCGTCRQLLPLSPLRSVSLWSDCSTYSLLLTPLDIVVVIVISCWLLLTVAVAVSNQHYVTAGNRQLWLVIF